MGKCEKIGMAKKEKICERSEPRGSLGRRKGGVPGDIMSLMPPIPLPEINLSLSCQHVKFSSRICQRELIIPLLSKKKYLNSR